MTLTLTLTLTLGAIDEAKRLEDLTRWKRRATAFEEIALPLIEQATKQDNEAAGAAAAAAAGAGAGATQDGDHGSGPTLTAHAQHSRGGRVSRRRSTIMMLEDMSQTLAKAVVIEGELDAEGGA